MTKIFVFGSNLAGRHGAGSALHAKKHYGAQTGIGEGIQGQSYGIPTKDKNLHTLPLGNIQLYVWQFIQYAKKHPSLTFEIVKIGCGLAGYKESQIIPFFEDAPDNCELPIGWKK